MINVHKGFEKLLISLGNEKAGGADDAGGDVLGNFGKVVSPGKESGLHKSVFF